MFVSSAVRVFVSGRPFLKVPKITPPRFQHPVVTVYRSLLTKSAMSVDWIPKQTLSRPFNNEYSWNTQVNQLKTRIILIPITNLFYVSKTMFSHVTQYTIHNTHDT